jgi:two-component system, response regulator FlrC
MRVLIVGGHNDEIATAIGMAVERGATLRRVLSPAAGLEELCAGRGADLILIDVAADIGGLIRALAAERIFVPDDRLWRPHRRPRRGRCCPGGRPGVPAATA